MTRADDELTLRMLDLHAAGHRPDTIAAATRTTPQKVRARVAAVRADDCAHDPEALAYWSTR